MQGYYEGSRATNPTGVYPTPTQSDPRIDMILNSMVTMTGNATEVSSGMREMTTGMGNMTRTVETLAGTVGNLSGNVENLSTNVGDLSEEVQTLQQRLDATQREVRAVQQLQRTRPQPSNVCVADCNTPAQTTFTGHNSAEVISDVTHQREYLRLVNEHEKDIEKLQELEDKVRRSNKKDKRGLKTQIMWCEKAIRTGKDRLDDYRLHHSMSSGDARTSTPEGTRQTSEETTNHTDSIEVQTSHPAQQLSEITQDSLDTTVPMTRSQLTTASHSRTISFSDQATQGQTPTVRNAPENQVQNAGATRSSANIVPRQQPTLRPACNDISNNPVISSRDSFDDSMEDEVNEFIRGVGNNDESVNNSHRSREERSTNAQISEMQLNARRARERSQHARAVMNERLRTLEDIQLAPQPRATLPIGPSRTLSYDQREVYQPRNVDNGITRTDHREQMETSCVQPNIVPRRYPTQDEPSITPRRNNTQNHQHRRINPIQGSFELQQRSEDPEESRGLDPEFDWRRESPFPVTDCYDQNSQGNSRGTAHRRARGRRHHDGDERQEDVPSPYMFEGKTDNIEIWITCFEKWSRWKGIPENEYYLHYQKYLHKSVKVQVNCWPNVRNWPSTKKQLVSTFQQRNQDKAARMDFKSKQQGILTTTELMTYLISVRQIGWPKEHSTCEGDDVFDEVHNTQIFEQFITSLNNRDTAGRVEFFFKTQKESQHESVTLDQVVDYTNSLENASKTRNPINKQVKQPTCDLCGSSKHLKRECPTKKVHHVEEDTQAQVPQELPPGADQPYIQDWYDDHMFVSDDGDVNAVEELKEVKPPPPPQHRPNAPARGGFGGGHRGGFNRGNNNNYPNRNPYPPKKMDPKDIVCFKCGEIGHFSTQCTRPEDTTGLVKLESMRKLLNRLMDQFQMELVKTHNDPERVKALRIEIGEQLSEVRQIEDELRLREEQRNIDSIDPLNT